MTTFKDFLNTKTQNTETYEYKDGFMIDITEVNDKYGLMYGAWVYHKDYGIKDYIIGVMAKDYNTKEDFIQTIFETVDDDIEFYIDEFMDGYID